jgi:hypothetical protein
LKRRRRRRGVREISEGWCLIPEEDRVTGGMELYKGTDS